MKQTNWVESYVKVFPRVPFAHKAPSASNLKEREAKQSCDDIITGVMRHIDNIEYTERVDVTESVCLFCGTLWTEKGDTFNGGCCEKDVRSDPFYKACK